MPNSTLTRGAVALMACLLLTAVQAECLPKRKTSPCNAERATVPQRGEAGLAHRDTPMRHATEWAGFDRQKIAAARLPQTCPHEGTFGYTAPPSVVMNR